ncbi:MAG: molybdopterin-synthase adenylyltransferase MoeB [Acidimicrobiia bacterium]|nr:MAG: molybdopterin-synthase adenylyltransferase MoeB [Acidimicrobiia bacterium]
MDYRKLIEGYREQVTEYEPSEAAAIEFDAVIDVREPMQRVEGSIDGSFEVPLGTLERDISGVVGDPNARILLYCVVGQSSILAAHTMQMLGYTNVSSLAGGFRRWRDDGLPWSAENGLALDERTRYDRQLRLDRIGSIGQQRLLSSSALIVGIGGLGSPAALYLAAAGVGIVGIVDDDRVEVSNLHRQIIHDTPSLGRPKTQSAADRIGALNPGIKVRLHEMRLTEENATNLVAEYDIVIDASDNFETRLALNDASITTGVPVVHASALRFEGTVAVFDPPQGPCYRCLFPVLPEDAMTCSEAGVLGAMTGVIGSTQAVEAIKVLVGAEPLSGTLLTYDALASQWSRYRFDKDPDCPACG